MKNNSIMKPYKASKERLGLTWYEFGQRYARNQISVDKEYRKGNRNAKHYRDQARKQQANAKKYWNQDRAYALAQKGASSINKKEARKVNRAR